MGLSAGLLDEEQKREYSDRELLVRYVKGVAPFRKNITWIQLVFSSVSVILILGVRL